jgi:ADP-heptose:LPS heptosyltransferase
MKKAGLATMSVNTEGKRNDLENVTWINPLGGLGDALMLSGVLKLVHDAQSETLYHCVRRTQCSYILRGHPAIHRFDFPPTNARIVTTDYWAVEKLGPGHQRAFQVLARMFGLTTPVEERLYIAPNDTQEEDLTALIPWGTKNVIIAPSSDSPRKMLPVKTWENVTEILKGSGVFVVQVGRAEDRLVKGAYSLLGLTTPRQLIRLVGKADMVITVDNFVMHAAHLSGVYAVVLWGPTDPDIYGYVGHMHLRGTYEQCEGKNRCLGPGLSENYPTPCPMAVNCCIAAISDEKIIDIVKNHLYY